MAVIKDVAKMAGVSIGTVSKYFNHPDQLRPATRERVAQVVEALDYRPNPIARSMRTGKTQIVAVLVPEIANPFYAEGFSSLSAQMVSAGYLPLLITTDNNPALSDARKLSLIVAQTDAVILYLLDTALNRQLLPVLQEEKPTLLITQHEDLSAKSSLIIQEEAGMAEAAKHLIELGRRNIAFIGGPELDSMTDTKYSGFSSALELNGLKPIPALRCAGFSPRLGYLAAKKIMEAGHNPDAICCANDALAMGVIKYMSAHGIRVPEEVAVTGYDNLELSRVTEPELTTVALPLEEVAVAALRFVQFGGDCFGSEYLVTLLVVRGSTVKACSSEPFE